MRISQNHLGTDVSFFFSPPQILLRLKQVRFSLDNTSVYFDANGNPPEGYDIVTWVWRGTQWSVRQVGSFRPDPIKLIINADQIEWPKTGGSRTVRSTEVFLSVCKTFVKLKNSSVFQNEMLYKYNY